MTPLEKVIPMGERYQNDESGVILLDERIDFITEDGTFIRVLHQINRANTIAGAETLNRESFRFRKSDQSITLVLAHTVQPDNTRDEVQPNAAVLQDIVDAGNDLYEDRAELILIYPKVKPGSITESIIIKTQKKGFRIPGEYMTWVSSQNNIWPICLDRTVIDLPKKLSDRLKFVQLGANLTKKKILALTGGKRTRLIWEKQFNPRAKNERGSPPTTQAGPAEFLTTWESWDDMALWYETLMKGRTDLGKDLIAKNKEWVKDKKNKKEIIQKLFSIVANDVRYVGLEFGIAGFQPYSCQDVWNNLYGDCKDKSSLLCALLSHNGIEAYPVLVDTSHSGKVVKKWPSYQTFDHMIVAIKNPDKKNEWQFLDPTLSRAKVGTVGQWVAGRDVLVLKDKKGVWVRTPPIGAGDLNYSFDLDLETSGNLSGWFELNASGYYASSYADDYAAKGRQATLRSLQKLIRRFYPRADVVDFKVGELKSSHQKYRLKAFFNSPHPFPQGENQSVRFSFPEVTMALPWLGEHNSRDTPFFLWKDHTKVTLKVKVPDGWTPGRLPEPISMHSDFLDSSGTWKALTSKNQITGEFKISLKKSEISPNNFAGAYNSVNALSTWLKHSAEFIPGEQPVEVTKKRTKSTDPVTMEIMPTGEGQLSLVDIKYPLSGDHVVRLNALRKVIQYFPNDKETRFSALSQIAYMAYNEKQYQKAIKQIEAALNTFKNDVEMEDRGWGEYIRALSLSKIDDRKKEAILEFSRLSKDNRLSDYRRCWAAYRAGALLKDSRPDESIAIITPLLGMDEERIPYLYRIYAEASLTLGNTSELEKRLGEIIKQENRLAGGIFSQLTALAKERVFDQVKEDTKKGSSGVSGKMVHQILASLDLSEIRETDTDLDKDLENLMSSIHSLNTLTELQQKFQKLVQSKEAPPWLREGKVDSALATAEDFESALDKLRKGNAHGDFISTAVAYLEKFPPQSRYSYFLWRLLAYVEWKERPAQGASGVKNGFFPKLAKLTDQIPRSDEEHWECQFVRGRWYKNHKLFKKEAALYHSMLDDSSFDDSFSVSAAYRQGIALEKTGQFKKAAEAYLQTKDEAHDVTQAVDGMLRAAIIRLELGLESDALKLLDELRSIEKEHRGKADYSVVLELLLKLSADKKTAKNYWKHSATWWAEWQRICKDLPGGAEWAEKPLVGLIDDGDLYQQNINEGSAGEGSAKLAQSYAQAAHLSRWLPDYLPELGRITIYGVGRLKVAQNISQRAFVAKTYKGVQPVDDEDVGEFRLYHVVSLADDQAKESANIARKYFEKFPTANNSYDQAIARVWAIAALKSKDKKDIVELTHLIKSQLNSAAAFSSRALSVTSLADLLRNQQDFEGEKKLLEKELKNPDIRADKVSEQRLSQRLKGHIEAKQQAGEFSTAVKQWIEAREYQWLEFCEPLTLKDNRMRDLEGIVSKGSSRFSRLESIKAWLLIAEKSDITINSRWEAFRKAVDALDGVAQTYDESYELYRSALQIQEIPLHLRSHYAFLGMLNAARKHQLVNFQKFHNHDAIKKFFQSDDERITILKTLARINPSDTTAWIATAEKMWSEPVGAFKLNYLKLIYAEMLEYGNDKEAEKLRKSIEAWQFDSEINQSLATIKLEFLKIKSSYQKNKGLNATLRKLISERLGYDRAASDEVAFPYFPEDLPHNISEDLVHTILLRAIKANQIGFWNFNQWFRLCQALDYSEENIDLRFEVAQICLEMTTDDETRSSLLSSLPHFIDTDEASNRERIEKELLLPWEKKNTRAPLTSDAILYHRIKMIRRTGSSKSIEKELRSIKHPQLQSSCQYAILEHALVTQDDAMLKRTLDRLSADELVSQRYIKLSWLALDRLKRNAELELVREEATHIRNRELISAWATGDFGSAGIVIELTKLINDQSALPEKWVDGFLSRYNDKKGQLFFQIIYAESNNDWPRVVKYAEEGITKFPTYYHLYGALGRAHFNLGHKSEAREPLKTFIRYENDNIRHPEAVDMLKKSK